MVYIYAPIVCLVLKVW